MAELGILANEHLELIDGDLIVTPPQGPIHASLVSELGTLLHAAYSSAHGFVVRPALPLSVSLHTEPEPDLAVVLGDPRVFRQRHPRGDEAVLAIEIAYTSLKLDHEKMDQYAAGGVPVYWIIDVKGRTVEVYSEPHNGRYQRFETVGYSEILTLPESDGLYSLRLSDYL
jgi:Uma2 family endonuclease